MRSIFTGFLLFFVWASFGRWYYVCKVKGHCTPTTEEARLNLPPKTLGIYYSDTLLHKGYEQFVFNQSSVHARFTSNNTSFLNRLKRQMLDRQQLEVVITGFYLESEKNQKVKSGGNLGKARANRIQDWLIKKGIEKKRIEVRSQMVKGRRLIEPLKFRLVTNSTATAGN